jgi:hypothetical protein
VALAVVGVFAIFTITGCGPPPAVVRGTVGVNGAALSSGSITFEPADGVGPSVGTEITDGRFELPATSRMQPGKKRVVVRGSIKTGKQVPAAPPAPAGVMVDDLKFYPSPGGQPETREVEVKEGVNELRIELTDKGAEKPK